MFITRHAHTDYMTVLGMDYASIARLFKSLKELMLAEKQANEKAASEAKSKRRK